MVNRFAYVLDNPSGFVTTTFHDPAVVPEGITNLHFIVVPDETDTPVATIAVSPDFVRDTFAPDTKFSPSRSVMETVVPAVPMKGSISFILGADALEVVAVAVATVVVFAVAVVATVVTVVGAPIVTSATTTVLTFSVNTFSRLARLNVVVLESTR